jgi:hypothetical protein
MKSIYSKILALILVMSSLLSMCAIFVTAEEANGTGSENGETTDKAVDLMYYRTFDDGLDVFKGASSNRKEQTEFVVDEGQTDEGRLNKFMRIVFGITSSDGHDYMDIQGAGRADVGTVFEFDIMTEEDSTNAANPICIQTKGASTSALTPINVFNIKDNKVSFLGKAEYANVFTMEAEVWYKIQVILDYTEATQKENSSEETFKLTIKYGLADGSEPMKVLGGEPIEYTAKSGNGLRLIRIQATGGDKDNFSSICLDNIKYYEGTNQLITITDDMGLGVLVGAGSANGGAASGVGTEKDLAAALSMKIGVNYTYANETRNPIYTANDGTVYGAPVKVNGHVMVPLVYVLDYIGYNAVVRENTNIDIPTGTITPIHLLIGDNRAEMGNEYIQLDAAPTWVETEEGNQYIVMALSDISKLFPEYYTDYDDMGYMVVSKIPDLLDRTQNTTSMVNTMKKFVFDYYDGDRLYNDVKEHTNFEHPYLLANGDDIARIREEYLTLKAKADAGELDEFSEEYGKLRAYQKVIASGEWYYTRFAAKDANGTYDTYAGLLPLEEIPSDYSLTQSHPNTGGYDAGGRSDIPNRTSCLEGMAFAYVLTEDTKYLEVCYEAAIYLGQWDHWGPGHFLNCADSANDFAIYYDWTYQGYLKLAQEKKRLNGEDYDVTVLAEILARQGVHEGYLSTIGIYEHVSEVVGSGGSVYSNRTNNWAAVCVGGMTIAALAIFDGNAGEEYLAEAKYMVGENLESLLAIGLDLYAPDGSYIEGPGYWNYGTNNFFRMCAALDSAAGSNYGLMDCWGMDTTCYYACHTEDNNSMYFPYHDGSVASQDTSYFFYVADFYNDATLYAVRYNQIHSGVKNGNILDMIYYPDASDMSSAGDIQYDYYAEGIDLFATRSSWEKDALFVSMIGGKNKVSHGQMDAGDFVYHNGGYIWIYDLGTENYNCAGFWPDETRYKYYVMKPEGNNTLAISSDPDTPNGQLLTAEAKMYKWGSNEYGAYAAYDMGKSLGSDVYKWERGVLLTNDRKTTVIQDQVDLANNMHTIYWFAHYNINTVDGDVTISDDGKTAYMRHYAGKTPDGEKLYDTLRLTIVTPNVSTLKFRVMSTYDFIRSGDTYSPEQVKELGGDVEKSRENYMKLAICGENVNKFDVAVVIEMVDNTTVGKKSEIDVGYSFVKMSDEKWIPTADTRGSQEEIEDTVDRRGTPNIRTHLVTTIDNIDDMAGKGTLYTEKIAIYFRDLTNAYYAVRMIGSDIPENYRSYVTSTNKYKNEFNAFREAINKLQKTQRTFVNQLMTLG